MFEAIKPLLDSGIINEETRTAISEAWEKQLTEAREEVRAELREEFARRYYHDKNTMVEALDKMVTESLTAEISEFAEEKKALVEDRVKFKKHMMESSEKFNDFMVSKLAAEIKELREDRKQSQVSIARLEKFVVQALAREITEFTQDKRDVVETKVRLVSAAKEKLAELRGKFVARSAVLVKEAVTKSLAAEMTQLKEDIALARESMFGRRIFEAFANEFAATHLNENMQIRKLTGAINKKDKELVEARRAVAEKTKLVESKNQEVRVIQESATRDKTLGDLLKSLNKEKAAIMRDLLENVQTNKLQSVYDKYLPAVLNNIQPKAANAVLVEGRKEVTGDKSAKLDATVNDNIIDMKRLAGLK